MRRRNWLGGAVALATVPGVARAQAGADQARRPRIVADLAARDAAREAGLKF